MQIFLRGNTKKNIFSFSPFISFFDYTPKNGIIDLYTLKKEQ